MPNAQEDGTMKLGLFMMPLHGLGMDYGTMYRRDYEAIRACDELGLDEAWVGEHYSAQVEPISNPLQFLSSLIYTTKSIKLATGVLGLAHHHPAKTAADLAMFDHMSGGRLILGIGPGGLPSDFELFGLDDPPERGQRMLDCLDVIQRIWASDPPYDIRSKYWHIRIDESYDPDLGIGIMPKPMQEGGPPVVTTAMAPFSGMAGLAGENGWGLISANFNPISHSLTHWQRYAEGAGKTGRAADRRQWRLARSIVVADTNQQADDYLARAENSVADTYHYLRVQFERANLLGILKNNRDMSDAEVTHDYCIDTMVVKGSPASVADQLCTIYDQTGGFGGLLAAYHDWDDSDFWRRSTQLLAQEVMPVLRKHAAP
jgi:alkanesulfonate monooxygenase SsuD/methylene tetrahydromethanopterin reductase-like flavin-dependent oxidoreductase (luciferase family)